jgi:hypothetical protein
MGKSKIVVSAEYESANSIGESRDRFTQFICLGANELGRNCHTQLLDHIYSKRSHVETKQELNIYRSENTCAKHTEVMYVASTEGGTII